MRTLLIAALLAAALPVWADATPTPSDRAASTHDFADVAYWHKVFDDPQRDEWQKPDALVAALQIASGSTVADLGAGTGYLTARLSKAVGPSGTVLAVETEPTLVAYLRQRAEREHADNVVPILTSADRPRLPRGSVDLIVLLDTYHHLDRRHAYLPRLAKALKRGGRIAVIDWQAGELAQGPPPEHKLPRQQVVDEMRTAGLALSAEPDVLPYQYLLVFTAAPPPTPGRGS
jgi:ubiquinone/menaquinone biosynthesis C-methylase UbiE